MSQVLRRQALPIVTVAAISTAALAFFIDAAAAQDVPKSPDNALAGNAQPSQAEPGSTLPEVEVIQAKPTPAPKSKQKKNVASKPASQSPKPAQAPAPVDFESVEASAAFEPVEGQHDPLANRGTPSANVARVNGLAGSPGAQSATGIDMKKLGKDQVFSVADMLRESPGVSLKQGNGPRDIGISIRGSNARNSFGIRNIVLMEDGFTFTQPDGLSRTDLTDPHAYIGVDVWRGPTSALFGNYATGGAINFRTRQGGDINGVEYGSEFGSNNYVNNYLIAGGKSSAFEGALFLSDVRGDGFQEYSAFNTQTINALMSVRVTEADTVTVKVINNNLHTELPFRYSLNQFLTNPYQKGCETAATAAPGCVTQSFSSTGVAPFTSQTAEQAGASRDDRRTIVGTRWEHKFDADSVWRVQYIADDRNIRQPTGTTSAKGDFFSHNVSSDYSQRMLVAGLPSVFMIGGFWNYLPVDSDTYRVAPGGGANHGLRTANSEGSTTNFGARAREEISVTNDVTVIAGIGVEKTLLEGVNTSFGYNRAGNLTSKTAVSADRSMVNVAPEIGLLYQPNTTWQFRGRIGTGYGTPQFSNLFVAPDGTSGNNTDLQTQSNVGYDLGVDWTPAAGISVSVTGFYEFFKNELVTQATPAGAPNASFTFNAPASEHRGIEAAVDWRPFGGWRMTGVYTFNDQIYTDYVETLKNGATVVAFDRAGNKIPGIALHEITARLGYDEHAGLFEGFGAFVEYQWRDSFFMENANLLKASGAEIVNVNVHYNQDINSGIFRSIGAYFEVRNIFHETYIAAANNIGDGINAGGLQNGASVLANTTGTIYSGAPRTYYGGIKFKF